MRATAFVVALSMALLSTVALAGQDDLIMAKNPMSRDSKAVVPGLIGYQGTLTDPSGLALDITETMTFTIYTDSIGGAAVWTETQPIVEVNDGLFNVLLGRVNAIPDTVFTDPVRWLGVKVGGDPELEPRQRIAAVGYAFRASEADTADFARAPAPSDGDWTIDGNHMYSAVPGSVGIGITDPVAKLHVLGGNIAVSDAGAETGIKIAESWIADPYDGALHIQSGGDVVVFDGSDDVGIGTAAPAAKLDVIGDINTNSLYKIRGNTVLSISDTFNVFVGAGAGKNNTGDLLTFVGDSTGHNNQGDLNTFLGTFAGVSNTTGFHNTFVGANAGGGSVAGDNCTSIGWQAGWGNEGSHNICVGVNAGKYCTTGDNNIFLGTSAGYYNYEKSNNIVIGYWAGYSGTGSNNVIIGTLAAQDTVGSANVFIGNWAGYYNKGSNNVFIGYDAGRDETGSNKLYIANSWDTSSVLIYGDFSTGNVGLGTLSPTERLEVDGSIKLTTAWSNIFGENLKIWGDSNSDVLLQATTNGNVGIGTTSPTRKLFVDGDAGGTTAWYNDSDARLKKNVAPIDGALDKVSRLEGVYFEWRDAETRPPGQHVGLIAQEVAEVVPEAVEKKGEYYSMATANLVPVLVEAVKEQQEIIERLESRIEELEAVVR